MKLNYKERRQLYDHFKDSEVIARRDAPPPEPGKEAPKEEQFKDRQLGMALDYLKNQIALSGKSKSAKSATVKK
jgi:hypothetical protein